MLPKATVKLTARVIAFGTGAGGVGKGRLSPRRADKSFMQRLYWGLARLDCISATLLVARGDFDGAARFVVRAMALLECRARSRDPQEPWQPVLAARDPSLQ